MRTRKFREEDALQVYELVEKGFVANSDNYSAESIKEQIEANSPENLIKKSKTVNYFIVTEKDKILGIGGYDENKVHTFFVDPDHHRKGIGGRILQKVLAEAKKKGIKHLDCWSTFQAEQFYSTFGFQKIKVLTLQGKGSAIDFVLMRKKL
jgi:N-acetylglutamate synthase-like GNAT family acetyltransferase